MDNRRTDMKKWNIITCILIIALLFGGGAVSFLLPPPDILDHEKREVHTPVPVNFNTLRTGAYTRSLDDAYADRFPGRDYWMQVQRRFNRTLQYFSSDELNVEGDEGIDPHDETARKGGFLIADDRTGSARIMFWYDSDDEYTEIFTGGINALVRAVGNERRVALMQIPGPFGVYAADRHVTPDNDQVRQITEVAERIPGIEHIDVITPLRNQAVDNTERLLFYRSDHHWTVYGAYVAYAALCEAWGFEPASLSDMTHGYYGDFLGSYYRQMAEFPQSAQFEREPDVIDYYLPHVQARAMAYNDIAMTGGWQIRLVVPAGTPGEQGHYGIFTEGDHAVTVVTAAHNTGRRLLIVKDSYTNALIPFLAGQFDEIVAVDYRRFGGENQEPLSIADFSRQLNSTHVLLSIYAKAGHDPLAVSVAEILP
jgi:hypothetical protein